MPAEVSPMMQQYIQLKEQYNDCLLFFRLGDFYEMFFDDAVTASRELELVLTEGIAGLTSVRRCAAFLFMLPKLISIN